MLIILGVAMAFSKTSFATENNNKEDLLGVILPAKNETMQVICKYFCDKSIYDSSFDKYFESSAELGIEDLLNSEKVYVNGIPIPADPEYFELNGSNALWQLDNGNWTWKSHDVMWGDETGEGVTDYAEARKNFLNGLTQFRGMTAVFLANEGSNLAEAVAITIVNSGMVESITDNGNGTITVAGIDITAPTENFDSSIEVGDIAIYWVGADGIHIERAIAEPGVYHYVIGEEPAEAFVTDLINDENYIDAQIARNIQSGSRPNQFARAVKRLKLQDSEIIGWWTETHYLIGMTRDKENAISSLELAISNVEAGVEEIVVSEDGTNVATDTYWVNQKIWDEFQNVLISAKEMLTDENATSTQIDQVLSDLAETYGDVDAKGDYLTGPVGVLGSMQLGTMK